MISRGKDNTFRWYLQIFGRKSEKTGQKEGGRSERRTMEYI